MKRYRLYVFDLDGTLVRGDAAIPGAPEALAGLRAGGAQVRFLTNNSTQSVEAQVAKLRGLGFQVEPNEVTTSATGAAAYLAREGLRRVFVLGEPGLVATLRAAGLSALGPDDAWEGPADAVVAGLFRQFGYDHVRKGMASIRAGARFVATNADATFPIESGGLIPGAGSLVGALRACAEVEPAIVGKPSPLLTLLLMREAGAAPEETLSVGDRMDTDVASALAAGCDALLVLTGVTPEPPPGQLAVRDLRELL